MWIRTTSSPVRAATTLQNSGRVPDHLLRVFDRLLPIVARLFSIHSEFPDLDFCSLEARDANVPADLARGLREELSLRQQSRKIARWRAAWPLFMLLFCAMLSCSAQDSAGSPPSSSPADSLIILHAFYQGGQNGPSVAIAKAAIATFGYPGVYAVPPVDDGTRTHFQLRDGSSVEVSNSDLVRGKAAAKFLTDYPTADKRIADQAATLYALMIARAVVLSAQSKVFHDAATWPQAELLLSGNMGTQKLKRTVAAQDLPVLLGLKSAPPPYRNPLAYIHVHGDHASFATGTFIDQGGTATPLWKIDLHHGNILDPGHTRNGADFVLTQ